MGMKAVENPTAFREGRRVPTGSIDSPLALD